MPDFVRYLILGAVQGISEFLPISSDGHLVILSRWIETPGDELRLVVFLHLGSLAAIVLHFRREILAIFDRSDRTTALPSVSLTRSGQAQRTEVGGGRSEGSRLLYLLFLASLPALVIGPLAYAFFLSAFKSTPFAGAMLILTGIILFATRALPDGDKVVSAKGALIMGFAQALALLPGLSRSALTLAAGFAVGGDRRQVARFSFLMAIPAIAGANVFEVAKIGFGNELDFGGLAVGIGAAFLASLAAIRLLLGLVKRGRFEWFGVYCVAAGLFVLSLG